MQFVLVYILIFVFIILVMMIAVIDKIDEINQKTKNTISFLEEEIYNKLQIIEFELDDLKEMSGKQEDDCK